MYKIYCFWNTTVLLRIAHYIDSVSNLITAYAAIVDFCRSSQTLQTVIHRWDGSVSNMSGGGLETSVSLAHYLLLIILNVPVVAGVFW
jgi:hypothetical protein